MGFDISTSTRTHDGKSFTPYFCFKTICRNPIIELFVRVAYHKLAIVTKYFRECKRKYLREFSMPFSSCLLKLPTEFLWPVY